MSKKAELFIAIKYFLNLLKFALRLWRYLTFSSTAEALKHSFLDQECISFIVIQERFFCNSRDLVPFQYSCKGRQSVI
jgi:hypothetical protein